ncbi:hypothetical protein CHUAL_002801 [Chamberlinius hualienensis]
MSSSRALFIPEGLEKVLEGLAREILRRQPTNLNRFSAVYFDKLLQARKKAETSGVKMKLENLVQEGKCMDFDENDLIAATDEEDEVDEESSDIATLGLINGFDDILAKAWDESEVAVAAIDDSSMHTAAVIRQLSQDEPVLVRVQTSDESDEDVIHSESNVKAQTAIDIIESDVDVEDIDDVTKSETVVDNASSEQVDNENIQNEETLIQTELNDNVFDDAVNLDDVSNGQIGSLFENSEVELEKNGQEELVNAHLEVEPAEIKNILEELSKDDLNFNSAEDLTTEIQELKLEKEISTDSNVKNDEYVKDNIEIINQNASNEGENHLINDIGHSDAVLSESNDISTDPAEQVAESNDQFSIKSEELGFEEVKDEENKTDVDCGNVENTENVSELSSNSRLGGITFETFDVDVVRQNDEQLEITSDNTLIITTNDENLVVLDEITTLANDLGTVEESGSLNSNTIAADIQLAENGIPDEQQLSPISDANLLVDSETLQDVETNLIDTVDVVYSDKTKNNLDIDSGLEVIRNDIIVDDNEISPNFSKDDQISNDIAIAKDIFLVSEQTTTTNEEIALSLIENISNLASDKVLQEQESDQKSEIVNKDNGIVRLIEVGDLNYQEGDDSVKLISVTVLNDDANSAINEINLNSADEAKIVEIFEEKSDESTVELIVDNVNGQADFLEKIDNIEKNDQLPFDESKTEVESDFVSNVDVNDEELNIKQEKNDIEEIDESIDDVGANDMKNDTSNIIPSDPLNGEEEIVDTELEVAALISDPDVAVVQIGVTPASPAFDEGTNSSVAEENDNVNENVGSNFEKDTNDVAPYETESDDKSFVNGENLLESLENVSTIVGYIPDYKNDEKTVNDKNEDDVMDEIVTDKNEKQEEETQYDTSINNKVNEADLDDVTENKNIRNENENDYILNDLENLEIANQSENGLDKSEIVPNADDDIEIIKEIAVNDINEITVGQQVTDEVKEIDIFENDTTNLISDNAEQSEPIEECDKIDVAEVDKNPEISNDILEIPFTVDQIDGEKVQETLLEQNSSNLNFDSDIQAVEVNEIKQETDNFQSVDGLNAAEVDENLKISDEILDSTNTSMVVDIDKNVKSFSEGNETASVAGIDDETVKEIVFEENTSKPNFDNNSQHPESSVNVSEYETVDEIIDAEVDKNIDIVNDTLEMPSDIDKNVKSLNEDYETTLVADIDDETVKEIVFEENTSKPHFDNNSQHPESSVNVSEYATVDEIIDAEVDKNIDIVNDTLEMPSDIDKNVKSLNEDNETTLVADIDDEAVKEIVFEENISKPNSDNNSQHPESSVNVSEYATVDEINDAEVDKNIDIVNDTLEMPSDIDKIDVKRSGEDEENTTGALIDNDVDSYKIPSDEAIIEHIDVAVDPNTEINPTRYEENSLVLVDDSKNDDVISVIDVTNKDERSNDENQITFADTETTSIKPEEDDDNSNNIDEEIENACAKEKYFDVVDLNNQYEDNHVSFGIENQTNDTIEAQTLDNSSNSAVKYVNENEDQTEGIAVDRVENQLEELQNVDNSEIVFTDMDNMSSNTIGCLTVEANDDESKVEISDNVKSSQDVINDVVDAPECVGTSIEHETMVINNQVDIVDDLIVENKNENVLAIDVIDDSGMLENIENQNVDNKCDVNENNDVSNGDDGNITEEDILNANGNKNVDVESGCLTEENAQQMTNHLGQQREITFTEILNNHAELLGISDAVEEFHIEKRVEDDEDVTANEFTEIKVTDNQNENSEDQMNELDPTQQQLSHIEPDDLDKLKVEDDSSDMSTAVAVEQSEDIPIDDKTVDNLNEKLDDSIEKTENTITLTENLNENLTEKFDNEGENLNENLTEKSENLSEKSENVDENLTEKSENVDENLTEKSENEDENLAEKSENVDENLAEKSEIVDENLAEKSENVDENLAEKSENEDENVIGKSENEDENLIEKSENLDGNVIEKSENLDENLTEKSENVDENFIETSENDNFTEKSENVNENLTDQFENSEVINEKNENLTEKSESSETSNEENEKLTEKSTGLLVNIESLNVDTENLTENSENVIVKNDGLAEDLENQVVNNETLTENSENVKENIESVILSTAEETIAEVETDTAVSESEEVEKLDHSSEMPQDDGHYIPGTNQKDISDIEKMENQLKPLLISALTIDTSAESIQITPDAAENDSINLLSADEVGKVDGNDIEESNDVVANEIKNPSNENQNFSETTCQLHDILGNETAENVSNCAEETKNLHETLSDDFEMQMPNEVSKIDMAEASPNISNEPELSNNFDTKNQLCDKCKEYFSSEKLVHENNEIAESVVAKIDTIEATEENNIEETGNYPDLENVTNEEDEVNGDNSEIDQSKVDEKAETVSETLPNAIDSTAEDASSLTEEPEQPKLEEMNEERSINQTEKSVEDPIKKEIAVVDGDGDELAQRIMDLSETKSDEKFENEEEKSSVLTKLLSGEGEEVGEKENNHKTAAADAFNRKMNAMSENIESLQLPFVEDSDGQRKRSGSTISIDSLEA